MEISATTNSAASTAATSRIGLADNFDNFLKLLTTQLQSQDPLSPLDAAQFTEQLVQFTGVEQAIKTNDVLGQLVALVRADQVTRAVDYLGAEVEANAQSVRLDGNAPATVHYRLDQPAAAATINIFNEAGRLVRTQAGDASPGVHTVPWDGRDQAGARLPDGLYRVEVAAGDGAGAAVPVSTTIAGVVDGVELQGDRLMLSVAGVLLPLDAVTTIRRPAPATA
jgi:flagellar basal-body rod modification protein FlgD